MVLAFTLRFLIQVWINICVWYEVGASITIYFSMWYLVLIAPHVGRNSFSLLDCFVEHLPLRKRLFRESWHESPMGGSTCCWTQKLEFGPLEAMSWKERNTSITPTSFPLTSTHVTCAKACVCMHAHAYPKYKHFPRRVCSWPPSSSPQGCQLQSLDCQGFGISSDIRKCQVL